MTNKANGRYFFTVFLCTLFFLACSCSGTQSNSDTSQITSVIAGRILDGQNNALQDALVVYTPSTLNSTISKAYSNNQAFLASVDIDVSATYSDITDSDGYYNFRAPSGTGILTVTKSTGELIYDNIAVTVGTDSNTLVNLPGGHVGILKVLQVNSVIDEVEINNSSSGYVELTVPGSSAVQYLNVSINDNWALQNVIIVPQPEDQNGQETVTYFPLNLGVVEGTDVTSAMCAFSILSSEIASLPINKFTSSVSEFEIILNMVQYLDAEVGLNKMAEPEWSESGEIVSASHGNGFPNQEAPTKGSCIATAVSNSLKYLNQKHNLGMSDECTSIETMRTACRQQDEKYLRSWYENKDMYMGSKNYPIGTVRGNNWDEIIDALRNDKDVEMSIDYPGENDGHCMAVVGVSVDRTKGRATVKVAHDLKQAKEGGCVEEELEFDISGEPVRCISKGWAYGSELGTFIIEFSNR